MSMRRGATPIGFPMKAQVFTGSRQAGAMRAPGVMR
jgi:hypothetical protein